MLQVAIIGSRDWPFVKPVKDLISVLNLDRIRILTGCCPTGVDSMVRQYAPLVKVFYADWNNFGKAAGPIRNEKMILEADMAYVFMKNSSRGSANVVRLCSLKNIPCFIMKIGGEDNGRDNNNPQHRDNTLQPLSKDRLDERQAALSHLFG